MPVITAIPTTYKGVTFASRLEADWVKNLDEMRIVWQYEPEGVRLPDGQRYLSDLFLPRINCWLEPKGPHNHRIDKPAALADALLHAPGCEFGNPEVAFNRPAGIAEASCPCGYGPDFPYMLVVVGRPATNGKMTFEATIGRSGKTARIAIMDCDICKQKSFTDLNGAPICRRCRQNASGSACYPSKSLPFVRVAVPVGARRKKVGTRR